jgi:gamma-glutamylputrescine oxidase
MLSYWEKDIFKPHYDFLIVGAGFSGLWLAFFLKKNKPNAKIAIFEKGVLPHGASTKNAGFACFGSPTELLENVKDLGWEKTLEWTKKRYEGIELIKHNFGNLVDYNACGASELFSSENDFIACEEKLELLNNNLFEITNNKNHFFIDENLSIASGFKGFDYAISNHAEAAIHSGKLFNELYKFLVSVDVKFFFNTDVLSFNIENKLANITTNNLGDFTSNHLSICTNAFSSNLLPDIKIKPGRGQMMVTTPIVGLKFDKTFHFDKGYFYFRNVGNRVLIGGGRNLDFEGETTTEFGLTETIQNELLKMLKQNILPNINFEIELSWSGIMAFNETKTPFLGKINASLSASVCMNGMGVALAPSLGKTLAEELLNS